MAIGSLIVIKPMSPLTGERVNVHLTDVSDRSVCALGGRTWQPAITESPKLGISLWNGDFTNSISPAAARFSFNIDVVSEAMPDIESLIWTGAPVEIIADTVGKSWPWFPRFKGVVKSTTGKGRSRSIACEVDTEAFEANVLTKSYAGTTGAEGPLDLKGQLKPLVVGWPKNVEPTLIDANNSVYQFSGYGPIEAVTTLFERGSAFASSFGDYGSYALLVAATIPRGRWATCLAEGMVRLGAPQAGVITGDVKGHAVIGIAPRLSGVIIGLLASLSGVDPLRIYQPSLDALDLAKPYSVNRVFTDQISFLDAAREMVLPLNYQAGVDLLGQFFASSPYFEAEPSCYLHAQGKNLPLVTDTDEQDVSPPYTKITMGASKSWRVHSFEEIAFAAPLIPRGLYDDLQEYREGHIVDLANGSQWLYTNLVATTGNDPPVWPVTSNAYWSNLRPPLNAAGLTYVDGTPIETLRPSEPGADVTLVVTGSQTAQVNFELTGMTSANLPLNINFSLIAGAATNVTTSAAWTATLVTGTATFTIGAATGTLNVTALSVDTVISVKAVYGGKERFGTATLLKVVANPPGGGTGGGTSDSAPLSATGQTSTYGSAAGRILKVKAGSGGQVLLTATANFYLQANGNTLAYGKWQWRPIAGSFADVAAETVANSEAVRQSAPEPENSPGYLTVTVAKTALTSGTDYEFQFLARSAGATINISGTQSGVGS